MEWLLMVVIYTKSTATQTEVSWQQFSSIQSCQAAKVVLDSALSKADHPKTPYTVCVKR